MLRRLTVMIHEYWNCFFAKRMLVRVKVDPPRNGGKFESRNQR